jgi:signal peptidase I
MNQTNPDEIKGKEPWLAVFWSRINIGFGFFYVSKPLIGIILLILCFIPVVNLILLLSIPFLLYYLYNSTITREKNIRQIILISVLSLLATFLYFIISFSIKTFVAEARYIPASSMEPTLQINDKLIVNKLNYHFNEPQRGDVIIFNPTDSQKKQNFNDALLKRIIGLPDETLEVKQGKVFINNKPLQENYIKEEPDYNYGPVTVSSDSYFVLGDNRNNSYDSHYWGFVPRENIIGKVTKIFYPFERFQTIK